MGCGPGEQEKPSSFKLSIRGQKTRDRTQGGGTVAVKIMNVVSPFSWRRSCSFLYVIVPAFERGYEDIRDSGHVDITNQRGGNYSACRLIEPAIRTGLVPRCVYLSPLCILKLMDLLNIFKN